MYSNINGFLLVATLVLCSSCNVKALRGPSSWNAGHQARAQAHLDVHSQLKITALSPRLRLLQVENGSEPSNDIEAVEAESSKLVLPNGTHIDAVEKEEEEEFSKPVSNPVTLAYYRDEPIFSLYLSQLPPNITQAQMLMGDECMTASDNQNLYRSKQKVIQGGCFGDLDDQFDGVTLVGNVDDDQPESFQVFATEDPNTVRLQRFLGSQQCEPCLDDRCIAENYTLPVNTCFYWQAPATSGSNFFVVVSRTDPMPDISLAIFSDANCTAETNVLKGAGADQCVGGPSPTPDARYDEGFEFREVINSTSLVDEYDISRWIRGQDCQEGFRSNFMGTAMRETVRVGMNKCTEWNTDDERTFYVKTTIGQTLTEPEG